MAASIARTCTIPGCGKRFRAKGMCSTHYNNSFPSPARRAWDQTLCAHCGAEVEKLRTSAIQLRFCSYGCRSAFRAGNPGWGGGRREGHPRTPVPAGHPARWIGDSSPVPWELCTDCGGWHIASRARQRCQGCARIRRYAIRSARHRLAGKPSGYRQRKWQEVRLAIFGRDDWICWLCEEPCDRDAPVPEERAATVDHLVPRSRGGGDEFDNLACAHFICNSRRGNSMELPVAA